MERRGPVFVVSGLVYTLALAVAPTDLLERVPSLIVRVTDGGKQLESCEAIAVWERMTSNRRTPPSSPLPNGGGGRLIQASLNSSDKSWSTN
jgi:hypothetical protein